MNTMKTDTETEAAIAIETGHELGCFEWWMETALEAGVEASEIYALWYQEVASGFEGGRYGSCHCEDMRDAA
jgi:hypothetical protein